MFALEMKVEGFDGAITKTEALIRKVPNQVFVKACDANMEKAAQMAASFTIRSRTGRLKNAWRKKSQTSFGNDTPYAGFHEFGFIHYKSGAHIRGMFAGLKAARLISAKIVQSILELSKV